MLDLYNAFTLTIADKLSPVEVAEGDDVTTEFILVDLDDTTIASVIQVGSTYLVRNLHWTISGSTVTFTSPPAMSAKITFVGQTNFRIAAYDQDPVASIVDPRIAEKALYLFDDEDIHLYTYEASAGKSGIEIALIDNDELNGADIDWLEFATSDAEGEPDTYGTAGDPINLPDIFAESTLAFSAAPDDEYITVADASDFAIGQLITLGHGTGNKEVRLITDVTDNDISFSALEFSHPLDEPVYHSGYRVWERLTVPYDAASNIPQNLNEIYYELTYDNASRI